MTRYMAMAVRSRPEFELLLEPETNILLYRYIPPQWREALTQGPLPPGADQAISRLNERLQGAQRRAGRSFVSRTALHPEGRTGFTPLTALRAVIASPMTAAEDIDAILEEQACIGAGLS